MAQWTVLAYFVAGLEIRNEARTSFVTPCTTILNASHDFIRRNVDDFVAAESLQTPSKAIAFNT